MAESSQIILPGFVFRGTSYAFKGSHSSRKIPYTCTTINPLKAVLFAMHCKLHYYDEPVVYVARTDKLTQYEILKEGPLGMTEEAITWKVRPIIFYKHCEGYIPLDEMKETLKQQGIYVSGSVRLHNLSERCEEAQILDVNVIENIVSLIKDFLKK